MKPIRLLAVRLFIILFIVLALGTLLMITWNLQLQSDRQEHTAVRATARISDVIKRSTRYGMMLNRREDIYQIISTIGNEPGIEAIRIYNKAGEISYSTEPGEVGSRIDMNAEGCIACHEFDRPPSMMDLTDLSRIFTSEKGYRVLGMITPIYNEESCSAAPCHAHSAEQTMLGVLDVLYPLGELDAAIASARRQQLEYGFLVILGISLVMGVLIWRLVNVPVRHLTKGTTEIIKGNLDHRINVKSRDEIGTLATSFNHMTEELQRARKEITEWTQTLEERVKQKSEELQRAQKSMVYVEKMASLGQLSASVAHELNNPLEGILTYARILQKRVDQGGFSPAQLRDVRSELTLIAEETARCGGIVKNLLLFSRQPLDNLQEADLRAILIRTAQLIEHHLKINDIKLVLETGEKPVVVRCDAQQIEQALLAMEINAVEAMPEGGTLTIRLKIRHHSETVQIEIKDTGVGIRDEDLPHIFEPFFTTKQHGKGTGLGLPVAYGIVKRHGGTIEVQSVLDRGTMFTVELPENVDTLAQEEGTVPLSHG